MTGFDAMSSATKVGDPESTNDTASANFFCSKDDGIRIPILVIKVNYTDEEEIINMQH